MHFLNALRAADCRRRSVECTDVYRRAIKHYDVVCTVYTKLLLLLLYRDYRKR